MTAKTKQYPAVIKYQDCTLMLELISPQMARDYLERAEKAAEVEGHRINRNIDRNHVEHFKAVNELEQWDPMMGLFHIDPDRIPINAQHRMKAIAEGTKSVWCLIVHDMPRRKIDLIDLIQKPRSLYQAESISRPDKKRVNEVFAACRFIDLIQHGSQRFLTIFAKRALEDNYGENIRAVLGLIQSGKGIRAIERAHVYAPASYLYPAAPEKVTCFIEELTNTVPLKPGSPAALLFKIIAEASSEKSPAKGSDRMRQMQFTLCALRHHIIGNFRNKCLKPSPNEMQWAREFRAEHVKV